MIPRAVASGNCDLLVRAQVVAIEGRSVRLVVDGAERTVRCDRVVVCAGAVETPRLLLASGVGNDVVGTNLHSHSFVMLYGAADEPLERFEGPGHSVATLDFVHRDGEAWGGGVLFDAPSLLPVLAAPLAAQFGHPLWGAGHKAWMRDGLRHVVGGMGIGQEIPSARARVTLDPSVRDVHGMPVARLHGDVHPATIEVRDYMERHLNTWLDEAGIARPVRLQLRPPAGRRGRALRRHLPDGRRPGDVGLRPLRPRPRQRARLRRRRLAAEHQRRREPVRDDDGQRVARGRRARQNGLSTSCAPGCPGALAQHGFSVAACASSSG